MFLCCLNAQHRVVGHRCTKETPCSCWKPFQIRTCRERIGIECCFALPTWKVTVGPSPNQSQAFSRQESFADGTGHLPSPFLFPICSACPSLSWSPASFLRLVPQICFPCSSRSLLSLFFLLFLLFLFFLPSLFSIFSLFSLLFLFSLLRFSFLLSSSSFSSSSSSCFLLCSFCYYGSCSCCYFFVIFAFVPLVLALLTVLLQWAWSRKIKKSNSTEAVFGISINMCV